MNRKTNKNSTQTLKFFISTFNAQSISNDSYMLEFENALKEIKFDVIGLSEVKQIGEEVMEMNGYIFYYKGVERRKGTVGFAINSKWKSNIQGFRSYSDRVVAVEMKFDKHNLGIIQRYAPTTTYSDAEVSRFYDQVSLAIEDLNKCTWLIVMGDMNAKIGIPSANENDVAGVNGFGVRNDRGSMLINFARSHQLFVANTIFKKRNQRKWTWTLGRARNEIDYILVKQRIKSILSKTWTW